MTLVLRSQGAALVDMVGGYPPKNTGGEAFTPCPNGKGVADLVTFSELFQFCTFIVSLISLIIEIILLTKKK